MILLPLFIFGLGLIIGSFLNVVILRINTGRSMVTGRSACARCNRTLAWYDLVPVLSFLALRGKCRTCKTDISFQYPFVELITAITFVLLYSHTLTTFGLTGMALLVFAFLATIASLLIVIFVYDIRHHIVPDSVVYSFIILSVAAVVWRTLVLGQGGFGIGIIQGVIVALPFFLLWACSKGRLMGFGDVKLALGMGWLLGLSVGLAAFIFSFWIGAVVGLVLLAISRRHSMKSQIPFAPFLILGLAIAGLWGIGILTLFPLWQ